MKIIDNIFYLILKNKCKMKKILLLLSILFFHASTHAFGPDRTLNPDSSYSIKGQSFLSTSFNGWIYCCFNYKQDVFTGYAVIVSKNNGITWDSVVDYSVPPGSAFYPTITDMIVAGSDSANLHIIISITANGAAGPESVGSVTTFDGITGISLGNPLYLGDAFTFSVGDIALCSDYRHPLQGANPYDIAVAVTQNGAVDSVLMYYSNDGGLNFSGPFTIAATTDNIGSVDIAFGSYSNPNVVGRFSIVWESDGHIGASQSDVGMPTVYSGYNYLDTTYSNLNGLCYSPVISIQSADYFNSTFEYTTVILFERYDSTNSDYDIMSFVNHDTQNGGFGYPLPVDTTSNNTISPAITFNESNGNFLSTWFDSTNLMLSCHKHDFDFADTAWILLTNNYADTSSFSIPNPAIAANETSGEICLSWIHETDTANLSTSNGLLKFDSEALPLLVTNKDVNNDLRLFPNPTNGIFQLYLKNQESILKVEYTDLQGRILFSSTSCQPGNRYFINTPPGIYFVRVISPSGRFVKQIIKY
jgi:hypothetical protein